MADAWHVRRAGSEDAAVLTAFRRAMFLDLGLDDPGLLDEIAEGFGRYLDEQMPAGAFLGWIAEAPAGTPIGCSAVLFHRVPPGSRNHTGTIGHLLNVYVDPGWRRRGVASALVAAVLDELERRGVEAATLNASETGRAVYERLGFERHDEMRLFLRDRPRDGG